MALPFVAGLAIGAGAVLAFRKSSFIKEKTQEVIDRSKEYTCSKVEQGKEVVSDVKDTIDATKECIKEKKEAKKLQAYEEENVEKIEDKDEKECKA